MNEIEKSMARVESYMDALRAVRELEQGATRALTAADRETLRYHIDGVKREVLPQFERLRSRIEIIERRFA